MTFLDFFFFKDIFVEERRILSSKKQKKVFLDFFKDFFVEERRV